MEPSGRHLSDSQDLFIDPLKVEGKKPKKTVKFNDKVEVNYFKPNPEGKLDLLPKESQLLDVDQMRQQNLDSSNLVISQKPISAKPVINKERAYKSTSIFLKIMKFIPSKISSSLLQRKIKNGGETFKRELLAHDTSWFKGLHPREFKKLPVEVLIKVSSREYNYPDPNFFREVHVATLSAKKLMQIARAECSDDTISYTREPYYFLNDLHQKIMLSNEQKTDIFINQFQNVTLKHFKGIDNANFDKDFFESLTMKDFRKIIDSISDDKLSASLKELSTKCSYNQLNLLQKVLFAAISTPEINSIARHLTLVYRHQKVTIAIEDYKAAKKAEASPPYPQIVENKQMPVEVNKVDHTATLESLIKEQENAPTIQSSYIDTSQLNPKAIGDYLRAISLGIDVMILDKKGMPRAIANFSDNDIPIIKNHLEKILSSNQAIDNDTFSRSYLTSKTVVTYMINKLVEEQKIRNNLVTNAPQSTDKQNAEIATLINDISNFRAKNRQIFSIEKAQEVQEQISTFRKKLDSLKQFMLESKVNALLSDLKVVERLVQGKLNEVK